MGNIRQLTFAAAGIASLTIGSLAMAQGTSSSDNNRGAWQEGYDAGVYTQFHDNFYSGCETWCASGFHGTVQSDDLHQSTMGRSYDEGYQAGLRANTQSQ